MGYVGNQTTNSYSSMDKQVITGNGGASYTLTHAVANAQEIEVFVNNVRQEAGVAYTVNGTALSMTGNVASSDSFYVIYQGKSLQTVVPPDGSVSTAKLASGAVTSAKLVYPLTTFSSTGIDDNAISTAMTLDSSGTVALNNAKYLQFKDAGGTARDVLAIDAYNGLNINSAGGGSAAPIVFKANNTETMRIDSSGRLLVGTTDTALYNNTSGKGFVYDAPHGSTQMLRSGGAVLLLNRASSDGSIVVFYQNGSAEGSVSVSGTTVSFNGGHLARWSRLADDSKDTSIVKGTVMTNLDEMVEWGDEDNEQLNKMAVSSVEGDVNVSGVFVNWDQDDDWNDMNIAMTGDMVIRIAQGTTVQRGDLLMSAGDGTAKPQGDDIVRSKTIAKVTSTHVSHTYDDGSYLVPCVLMAC